MTNIENYRQTLTKDELCAVVLGMRRFTEDGECPNMALDYWPEAFWCVNCHGDGHLCWCMHFVEEYRNKQRETTK